ncbi:amino acid ABC transporter permease [Bradyrhizobium sp.]|uniref:amino acid ABC transporter permease n=2 Tax=Bradyrhizobium sp. TaxID=376 RepID=UPI001DD9BB86|nr:amino acid ABC transporter permease [Bradyrhizobium sp.]MBV8700806.1 amino acid ABC transporter permease [Bradyrhizobium sp.]MBV8922164.1 amino acid ABC transporter permease [Bradyrhizobium sp.]MBV9978612.1 amino acid ABC transporter permease [Bradyrhizobium sp.]
MPMPDYSLIVRNASFLLDGLLLSLTLTLIGVIGGLAVGTALALVRLFTGVIGNYVIDAYVFVFRAIPLILVIFWFYFMVPLILGRPVGAWTSAIVAFTLFEAAYYSEILRAGLRSVRAGQLNAALASGMSRGQALRYVIFPQAFTAMIPIFLTQAIILFQDTSLVFVVSLHDFLTATSIIANRDGRLVEVYTFACLVYYLICLAATAGVEELKRTFAR